MKASQITILSPTEVSGSTPATGGWNKQPNTYTVYFYAMTDTLAAAWGVWHDGELHTGVKEAKAPVLKMVPGSPFARRNGSR